MMDDIYISLDDLKAVFRKKRRKILLASVVGAILCLIHFVFTPPSYEAVATFQQAPSRGEVPFDLKGFMRNFSAGGSEGLTSPLMLSRSVLGKTVQELGLQAVVTERGFWSDKLLSFTSNLAPKLDEQETFVFQDVLYDEEKPLQLFLSFSKKEVFEILSKDLQKLGNGSLNQPVDLATLTLTLATVPPSLEIGKHYPLTILPKRVVIERVKRKTSVKPIREEKAILTIKYFDRNRTLAAKFVNTLMKNYEDFLITENKTLIGSQLKYLEQRQKELDDKLDIDLSKHIAVLKKSLQEQGFMGVQQELKSILEPLKLYRERLDDIEVELAGLESRVFQSTSEPNSQKLSHQFHQSLTEQIQETSSLLQKLHREELASSTQPTFAALMRDVEQARQVWQTSKEKTEHNIYLEKRDKLAAHLQTFLHQLSSRQNSLVESSNYIDNLETDFLGISLDNARKLFQRYCNQLDKLHTQLKQVIFFRDHIHEPHFEISTLTNVLEDNVTEQLVQKSSHVEGQLHDSINHTSKEQERLRESLATNKKFLESHLSQTVELGKIRIQLIKEKIGSLYDVMRDLLSKEKEILRNKVTELKHNLSVIPDLWQLEKRLDFKVELTKGMMGGLTHIIETKNLSHHLYQVESKPLDTALVPLQPTATYLFPKCVGMGIGIAFVFYLFSLFQAFFKGLPISLTTLRLMGAHTSGTFSDKSNAPFDQLPNHDLETLRTIVSFLLDRKKDKGTLVSLLCERGANFGFNLASLLSLHHQTIAIIDCNFDRIIDPEDQPGLWHYLAGENTHFRHTQKYDFLPAGGTTRHGIELLASDRFSELLNQCKEKYDFIFLLRQSKLDTQDALQFLPICHLAVITIVEESQEALKPHLEWSRQKENYCATFTQCPMIAD